MTDELRFALQLSLNLVTVLVAGWLAGRVAARRVQRSLEAERQRAEEARRRVQAQVMASLAPIPPELEQMVETERWVLTARNLQLLLTSLGTLIRIKLRADEATRRGTSPEVARSLKSLERQENRWLGDSLPVVAFGRQFDPAKGKAQDQTLEAYISRLNQTYVLAAQSLRRAASLTDVDDEGAGVYDDSITAAYLAEADQATAAMASLVVSALDRLAYLKRQLPERRAIQIAADLNEQMEESSEYHPEAQIEGGSSGVPDLAATLETAANPTAR